MELTSDTTSLDQLFAKRTFPVYIKVITHESSRPEQTETSTLLASCKNLVAIVANLRILDSFFVVLPEALYATRALVLVSQVVPKGALDTASHVVPVAVSHSLESEELMQVLSDTAGSSISGEYRWTYSFRVLNESLCDTHLPFFPGNPSVSENLLTSRLGIALPGVFAGVRRGGREQVESLDHLLECVPVCKPGTPHANILLETKVFHLM